MILYFVAQDVKLNFGFSSSRVLSVTRLDLLLTWCVSLQVQQALWTDYPTCRWAY